MSGLRWSFGEIVNSVRRVLENRNIEHLTKQAYEFIILYMGFIAHYNRQGFQDSYTDLRDFVERLQTSEYSNDPDHNLKWADELERRERDGDTGDQGKDKADIIREIVKLVRQYQNDINAEFAELQRQTELKEAHRLAGKYGFKVVPQ
ncbi:hypothetical protein COS91_06585 [Candidatus Desantisbacteria bacterium CG07_land_8_20_14_0_80_39_15]|uniref:Uncharacterized protein n=1 Tax=Candidatus Desantisbacteria bacterium CG07_land_8_20_14_0_80_39_15 TaxID=1974549 RepID=A0A2M6ZF72_9BACT|nr:MAG: hypothetical protein COS91_06585 [Candidatus Desantisbacteria bacterium CG07_land_8_20_14_0_80_39_15]